MSSSRSIAAARNRRAGGDVPPKLQAGRSMNTISHPPMQPHQHMQQQNIELGMQNQLMAKNGNEWIKKQELMYQKMDGIQKV